jgi:acyl carrier protein
VNEIQARDAVQKALARVAPESDLDSVRPDERLRDALDIDSLDFLSIVEQLHELTGVDIPETDYAEVETVSAMCGYLVSHGA